MKVRARHYRTGERVDITCRDGQIAGITPAGRDETHLIAEWVSPALFDLQINGCHGYAFSSSELTVDQVRKVVDVCRNHGIAGLCPTLVTNSREVIAHGFKTLRRTCEADPTIAEALPCFHLEGPYLSAEDGPRGAHPREHIRPPNWDEFRSWQDAAGGRIHLITLSPEYDDALSFIERLTASGVVVAIGHTAATGPRIREAIAAGARLSTHLGNGAHAVLPRHPNYIWEQLAADELWASVIPDGHHLPASVVKSIVRVKTPARTIITCDASSLAGLPPGRYTEWGTELEVLANGKIVVPNTPFLAGSGVFTDACVSKVIEMTGVGLADAIDMASARPRELLGLPVYGLEVGHPAKLMLFDWKPGGEIEVRSVVD
jgi:N-acetylglucosamine-6-phosphate deacetylase